MKIRAKIGTMSQDIIDVREVRINNIMYPTRDNLWDFEIGDKIGWKEHGDSEYTKLHYGIIDRIEQDVNERPLHFIYRM